MGTLQERRLDFIGKFRNYQKKENDCNCENCQIRKEGEEKIFISEYNLFPELVHLPTLVHYDVIERIVTRQIGIVREIAMLNVVKDIEKDLQNHSTLNMN